MTPYLAPGCPEELLITRNTLREVKQKGQAGREVNPSHDSPPVSTGTPQLHTRPGKDGGPAMCTCQPRHLGITHPGSGAGAGRGALPALRDRNALQLGRIRGHLCILWHWAGSTVAKPFPADICPIYFQNPPTVTLGNLFLCFPAES